MLVYLSPAGRYFLECDFHETQGLVWSVSHPSHQCHNQDPTHSSSCSILKVQGVAKAKTNPQLHNCWINLLGMQRAQPLSADSLSECWEAPMLGWNYSNDPLRERGCLLERQKYKQLVHSQTGGPAPNEAAGKGPRPVPGFQCGSHENHSSCQAVSLLSPWALIALPGQTM